MQQESKFEYLSGNVERVTYHNQENGFAVLRVKVKGHKDLVSVIGTVPSITPGEDITTKGYWGMMYNTDWVLELSLFNLFHLLQLKE